MVCKMYTEIIADSAGFAMLVVGCQQLVKQLVVCQNVVNHFHCQLTCYYAFYTP